MLPTFKQEDVTRQLEKWVRSIFKSRDFAGLERKGLKAQITQDAWEALRKYGETLDIRRESMQAFLRKGSEVPVQRVRLVYEGGKLKPTAKGAVESALVEVRNEVPGVEVLFQ